MSTVYKIDNISVILGIYLSILTYPKQFPSKTSTSATYIYFISQWDFVYHFPSVCFKSLDLISVISFAKI